MNPYTIRCLLLLTTALEIGMAQGENTEKAVPYENVADHDLWAMGEKQAYFVVTSKNWSGYYASPPHGADLSTCIYVVASMGVQPNPGYRIKIAGIKRNEGRVRVTVERSKPDRKTAYAQVLVTPVAVAEVKQKDLRPYRRLQVSFVDPGGRQIAEQAVEF